MLNPKADKSIVDGLSTLALAQLGDAVFELMVRTKLCLDGAGTATNLHMLRVRLVNAAAQSGAARKLLPYLTQEEKMIFMKGRNTKPSNIPKAATRSQYGSATALEALFGWLYLNNRIDRLNELFEIINS